MASTEPRPAAQLPATLLPQPTLEPTLRHLPAHSLPLTRKRQRLAPGGLDRKRPLATLAPDARTRGNGAGREAECPHLPRWATRQPLLRRRVFSLGDRAVGSRPPEWVCALCDDSRSKSWGLLLSSEAVQGWGRWEPLLSFSWGLSGRGQLRHQKARVGPGHQLCVGLGVLRPRPLPSFLLPSDLHPLESALPSLGSPVPSWGTPTPDSHRSASASETDFLQRCLSSGGKGRVPR